LCLALGGEELLRLGSKQDAISQKAFKVSLEKLFKQKSLADWQALFFDKDACVEPVLTFSEACENEQIKARGMVVSVPISADQAVDQIASPIKMSRCRPRYDYAGVALGEHNNQVLQELGVEKRLRDALQTSKAMG
jgi:crotonobetainyl-CoA:carnitine CoA-transferase CaiB-like acyl-CoA transferase